MRISERKSQELQEFINAQPGVPDDAPQGPTVKLPVVGDHHLSKGFISAEYDVASLLPLDIESDSVEGLDALPTRDPGQHGQTATTSVSNRSSGTARPSSSKASM